MFQTNANGTAIGSPLVVTAIAPEFTYYDQGASFGSPGPLYDSSQAVFDALTNDIGTSDGISPLVTDVQYDMEQCLPGCDFIVVRWLEKAKASANPDVTVGVGTPIEYRGTDYLQVDLSTRLIVNATSSGDLLNYYGQLGVNLITLLNQ